MTVGFIKKGKNSYGFTLIETLIVIAIIGITASIGISYFSSFKNRVKITIAIHDIRTIEKTITLYILDEDELPDSLSDIGLDHLIDPWGNPYQYLRLDGNTSSGIQGKRRRDKNANPANNDYDLYSMGQDGETSAQFTAKKARDDIVRANDGAYCGLAEKH